MYIYICIYICTYVCMYIYIRKNKECPTRLGKKAPPKSPQLKVVCVNVHQSPGSKSGTPVLKHCKS